NPDLDAIAIEPTPESFEVLARNVAELGTQRIALHRLAASDRDGSRPYIVSLSSDNCGFYPHPAAPPLRSLDVETTTVDALLAGREPCPIVIKIDTEGHELAVLAGMAGTLRRFHDAILVVEFNPAMARAAGERPERLLEELDRLGFESF